MGKMESGVLSKDQLLLADAQFSPRPSSAVLRRRYRGGPTPLRGQLPTEAEGCRRGQRSTRVRALLSGVSVQGGRVFDAEVVIQECKSIIAAGYSCMLHIHAAVEEVTVKVSAFGGYGLDPLQLVICVKAIICTVDKKGEKQKAKYVKQDAQCVMRLRVPTALLPRGVQGVSTDGEVHASRQGEDHRYWEGAEDHRVSGWGRC